MVRSGGSLEAECACLLSRILGGCRWICFWNPSLFVVCVTPSCPLLPLFVFEAARLRPRAAPLPCVAGLSILFSSGCEEGRGCQRDLRPSPICVCTELQLRPLVYFEFSPPVGLCQAPSFVSGGECHVLCCLCVPCLNTLLLPHPFPPSHKTPSGARRSGV